MANYVPVNPIIGLQAFDETSTTQQHELGMIIQAYDDSSTNLGYAEFIYAKGVASTAVGDAVIVNQYAATTTRTVANSRGRVGIAMSANVADQYGWYQISGIAVVNVAAAFASGAMCFATATAGTLDDAVVATDKVDGAISVTAIATPSAGKAYVSISRPFMGGNG